MAIELKYSICESSNCKVINFRELTGSYDVTDNTGGWGAPNELVGNAVTATAIFKSPGDIIYPSVDVLVLGFPRTDSSISKEINTTDLDSNLTDFVDGFWTITYTVTTGTQTYAQTKTFFLFCNIKKEVCKLVADMKLEDCACDPDSINRAVQMNAYLLALEYAVGLGDTVSAGEVFKTLQNLIDCSICK